MEKDNKKNSIFKIILIIVDILVLIGFIIISVMWINNNKTKNNNQNSTIINDNEYSQTATYKKFLYHIPKGVNFKKIDDKMFELSSDNYRAVIVLFIDSNNYIFEKKEKYYEESLKLSYNVTKPYEISINDTSVLIYNKNEEKNSLLCYFKSPSPFTIEMELFNKDNSFKTDYIESIIDILFDGEYDYYSEEKYSYYTTDTDPFFNDNIDNNN